MSNFDLTFCKVYIYAKGWPGINLGAWHESCAHPNINTLSTLIQSLARNNHRHTLCKKLDQNLTFLGMFFKAERAARAAQLARQTALRAQARAAQLAGEFQSLKNGT